MDTGIRIEGLDLVRKNLRNVQSQLPRGLTKIHKEVAGPVADTAKPKVRSRSGTLARSIRPSGTQRGAYVVAGRGTAYGAINHYGGYPGNYPGNPYLTDAIREETPDSIRLYDRLLFDFVEKVWADN